MCVFAQCIPAASVPANKTHIPSHVNISATSGYGVGGYSRGE